jgi:hypothetical protein
MKPEKSVARIRVKSDSYLQVMVAYDKTMENKVLNFKKIK